jgi:hypothetical protein
MPTFNTYDQIFIEQLLRTRCIEKVAEIRRISTADARAFFDRLYNLGFRPL